MTGFVAFLESLPAAPLYALITVLAALENVFPPVPADTAVALGAFLSGRGVMSIWLVFTLTWTANVGSGAGVYFLARRYGLDFLRGPLGRRLVSEHTLQRIHHEYARHGTYGIFLARLLPVWRGMVMPFAGVVRLSPARAIVPLALASAVYYAALSFLVMQLGTNLDVVLRALHRVNTALVAVALVAALLVATWIVRRMR